MVATRRSGIDAAAESGDGTSSLSRSAVVCGKVEVDSLLKLSLSTAALPSVNSALVEALNSISVEDETALDDKSLFVEIGVVD